jgi:hypothetical protein
MTRFYSQDRFLKCAANLSLISLSRSHPWGIFIFLIKLVCLDPSSSCNCVSLFKSMVFLPQLFDILFNPICYHSKLYPYYQSLVPYYSTLSTCYTTVRSSHAMLFQLFLLSSQCFFLSMLWFSINAVSKYFLVFELMHTLMIRWIIWR